MRQTRTVSVTFLGFFLFSLVALYYYYEYWLRVAPSVMSAELKAFFDISDPVLGHLSACYYYAYVVMQIPVGIILDRYGVRKVISVACGLCVLGTFLFARTDSFGVAQIGRFLMGFGSAFAYVGVLKVANVWFPQKYFGLAAGITTTLGMMGADNGLQILGRLVQEESWQQALNQLAWFGVVLTLVLYFCLKDKAPPKQLPARASQTQAQPHLLGSFGEIAVSPKIWLSGVIGSLAYLPISAFAELWAIPYLEAAQYTKIEAAKIARFIFWGFAAGGPLWGMISASLNSRRLPLVVGSMVAAVTSVFIVTIPQMTPFLMKTMMFLCGTFASAQILVFAVSNDLCASKMNATAVAFTNMLVMLGGALLQPIIGVLLHLVAATEFGGPAHLVHRVQSYEAALLILPMSLLLCAVLSLSVEQIRSAKYRHSR